MGEVQQLIVLSEELLDGSPSIDIDPSASSTPYCISTTTLWRRTASYNLSGGWLDNCAYTFGTQDDPFETTVVDFDGSGTPWIYHLNTISAEFWAANTASSGWLYCKRQDDDTGALNTSIKARCRSRP